MNRTILTPATIITVVLLSILMWIGGSVVSDLFPDGNFGICFPSPNLWVATGSWSSALNALLIILICITLFLTNKRYNLLKSGLPVWALFALPIIFSMLPVGGTFTSMPIVTWGALLTIIPLFDSYRAGNATRNVFFAATWIGIGSMMEYAMLIFLPALIVGLFCMHIARLKELIAVILGVITPYWIVVGLGLVGPEDFHIPQIQPIFSAGLNPRLFPFSLSCGILMLTSALLTLYNGMKLYAGNSRVRNYNEVINLFGLSAVLGLLIDTDNYRAYCGVFAIWAALQFANLFTLSQFPRQRFVYVIILLLIAGSATSQFLYLFG